MRRWYDYRKTHSGLRNGRSEIVRYLKCRSQASFSMSTLLKQFLLVFQVVAQIGLFVVSTGWLARSNILPKEK